MIEPGEWPTALDLLRPHVRLLLEHLPCEPNGLSIHELADGLEDDRSPRGRCMVRLALDCLAVFLGGLAVRRGDDAFGHADVELYGLPRDTYRVVCRMYAADARSRRHGH